MRWENKGYSEDEIRKRIKKTSQGYDDEICAKWFDDVRAKRKIKWSSGKACGRFSYLSDFGIDDEGTICQTGQAER